MRKKKLKLTPYNLFGLIVIGAFLAGTAYFLTMEPPSKEKICQQLLSEYDIPSDDYNKIFDTCIDKGPGDTHKFLETNGYKVKPVQLPWN